MSGQFQPREFSLQEVFRADGYCRFCGTRGCLICDAARVKAREEMIQEQALVEFQAVESMLSSERFQRIAGEVLRRNAPRLTRPEHSRPTDIADFIEPLIPVPKAKPANRKPRAIKAVQIAA